MKTRAARLLAALCALAALSPAYAADATAAEVPVLVAEQIDARGNPLPTSATVVEAIRLLAVESGVNLVVRPYPWRRAQMLAEKGEGLLYGAVVTPERSRVFSFTRSLYSVNQWLVSSAQNPLNFRQWEDLRGKTISIGSGAHYSPEFEEYRDKLFKVEENAASNVSRMKMVTARHADALLVDSYRSAPQLAAYMNCAYKEAGQWVVAEKPVGAEPALVAVPKASPLAPLLPVLNGAIERLTRSGGIQKMLESRANSGC